MLEFQRVEDVGLDIIAKLLAGHALDYVLERYEARAAVISLGAGLAASGQLLDDVPAQGIALKFAPSRCQGVHRDVGGQSCRVRHQVPDSDFYRLLSFLYPL